MSKAQRLSRKRVGFLNPKRGKLRIKSKMCIFAK